MLLAEYIFVFHDNEEADYLISTLVLLVKWHMDCYFFCIA